MLRATEGFTAALPGLRRRWLPMNSSMIATEPIARDVWDDDRLGRPGNRRRHRARILLRPTHRRRPHRDRRPQRALPLRVAHRRRRPRARAHHPASEPRCCTACCPRCATCRSPTAGAACSRCHATGRPAVVLDRATGLGLGGRLRRPRRHRHQPRRAHARRPGARPAHARSPSCRGSATGRATGSPSRCAGSACAASTSRTRPADWHEARRPRHDVADRACRRRDHGQALARFGLVLQPLQRELDVFGVGRGRSLTPWPMPAGLA